MTTRRVCIECGRGEHPSIGPVEPHDTCTGETVNVHAGCLYDVEWEAARDANLERGEPVDPDLINDLRREP